MDGASIASSDSHKKAPAACFFCPNVSKYVCPRCGTPYCSLGCYQSSRHQSCSEGFYRQCVEGAVASEQHDPEVRRRVQRALAREAQLQEEPDSDDSDSEEELSERLRGVDLDDCDAVWERLTESERQDFRRQAEAGAIAAEQWTPWWTVRGSRPKVTELGGVAVVPEFVTSSPALLTHVAEFGALSARPASPLVVNSLIGVLFTYAYLQLLYDGDWSEVAVEAAAGVRQMTACLAAEALASSRAAVQAVEYSLVGSAWQGQPQLRQQARRAVQHLLAGPSSDPGDSTWYVRAALSDLWRLLRTAAARSKADGARPRSDAAFSRRFEAAPLPGAAPVPAKELRRLMKRVEYLFSWSLTHSAEIDEKARGPAVDREIVLPSAMRTEDAAELTVRGMR